MSVPGEPRIVPPGRAPAPDMPDALARFDGQRQQRHVIVAVIVALVGAVVGVMVWQSTRSPSPVTYVRYVNDTGTRVVVSPCGAKQRCIIEAGASAQQKAAPKDAVSWPSSTRVVNARTLRLLGCLPYLATGTVLLSDADIGPDC